MERTLLELSSESAAVNFLNLKLGLVTEGTIQDEVLMELLDQQGIIYEIVGRTATTGKYPIVLLSKNSDASRNLARGASTTDDSVLVAEDTIDFSEVLAYLSGRVDDKRDHLDPPVNEAALSLTSLIREKISALNLPLVTKWFWPKMAKACCVLTHDIDWLSYSPFHKAVLGGGAAIRRIPGIALRSVFAGRDYGWNIPEAVKLEKKYGVKSTCFFRTEYDGSPFRLGQSIELLRSEGFEIGIHAANSAHESVQALGAELDSYCKFAGGHPSGIRHHILKVKAPETWIVEHEAGLQYDATLAYNRFFGFRGGACLPFHPMGPKRLPIIELPTSFMDWTALHRGLRGARMADMMNKVKGVVERFHGVFVVNFHNTYLNADTFPDVLGVYERLLKEVTSEGYWIATAKECADWWSFRSSANVSPRLDESGQVVCPESPVPLVSSQDGKEPVTIPFSGHHLA